MASLAPRQAVDELRRFIAVVEPILNSQQNGNQKRYGSTVIELSSFLIRLRETLSFERKNRDFAAEFVSKQNNGVELLLRTLSLLQRLLHEATQQQQPPSKFSTLLNRNGSDLRRKTGVAEADCLECLKLVTIQMPIAARVIMERVTYLEIILISITSPQLDSKCFALEIITQLLDFPDGFMVLFKAFTSVAGKNRDESRLALVVSQLKHGLNTSKLHIQILVTRFLNNLLSQAPNLNYRVIMQAEAENAGFNADKLEKKTSQYSRQADFEVLKRELIVWKNAYLPIVWLQQRQQELTFGTQPLDYLRQNNHRSYQNGDVRTTTSRSDSNRYETDTMSKSKSIGDDESDASTFLPDRYGQRAFSLNRSSKNNSSNAPVVKEVQKKKRDSDTRWSTGSTAIAGDEGKMFLETNPSYVPYPYYGRRSASRSSDGGFRTSKQRASSVNSQLINDNNSQGILKRPKSERTLYDEDEGGRFDRRTPREEEIFRRYPASDKFRSTKSRSVDGLDDRAGDEWSIPIQRLGVPPERQEPEGGSFTKDETVDVNDNGSQVRRTLSNASEKARMQGFSYLFPANPVLDQVPVRRAKTPTPLQEKVYTRTTNNSRPSQGSRIHERQRPTSTVASSTITSIAPSESRSTSSRFRGEDVVYIPLKVEETGQVLTRAKKFNDKRSYDSSSLLLNRSRPQSSPVKRFGGDNLLDDGRQEYRRFEKSVKGSMYGDDVEDALKRFDYLNDYSVDERSSRYAAP